MLCKNKLSAPVDFISHRGNELQSEETLTGEARLPGTRKPSAELPHKKSHPVSSSLTCTAADFRPLIWPWPSLLALAAVWVLDLLLLLLNQGSEDVQLLVDAELIRHHP